METPTRPPKDASPTMGGTVLSSSPVSRLLAHCKKLTYLMRFIIELGVPVSPPLEVLSISPRRQWTSLEEVSAILCCLVLLGHFLKNLTGLFDS